MSRTDRLCPIAHAACPARQRRMIQFIGSLTLEPAGYHGRAHLQRRLYLVPSMYNISMKVTPSLHSTWKRWRVRKRGRIEKERTNRKREGERERQTERCTSGPAGNALDAPNSAVSSLPCLLLRRARSPMSHRRYGKPVRHDSPKALTSFLLLALFHSRSLITLVPLSLCSSPMPRTEVKSWRLAWLSALVTLLLRSYRSRSLVGAFFLSISPFAPPSAPTSYASRRITEPKGRAASSIVTLSFGSRRLRVPVIPRFLFLCLY